MGRLLLGIHRAAAVTVHACVQERLRGVGQKAGDRGRRLAIHMHAYLPVGFVGIQPHTRAGHMALCAVPHLCATQVAAGGAVDVQVPILSQLWVPAEQGMDTLCPWHVDDPALWPHGTPLHTMVALGHKRAAAWLVDRGAAVDARVSTWRLTPLALLCCGRGLAWSSV